MSKFRTVFIINILFLSIIFSANQAHAQSKRPAGRDTVTIMPKSEWKGVEGRPYKQHVPVKITIHHEGGKVLTEADDAKQRLKIFKLGAWGQIVNGLMFLITY